ncbi:MAG: ribosome biogenesis GTPase YlqF [Tissierellia bacterium]|nr:ribosome biogenesis GTPase YlqF [Tissierellia bacterium]
MNINWYPGHMKKTKESIKKNLTLVDIVYELVDARIPISSQNPDIDEIIGEKPRIKLLNKSDLADQNFNLEWQNYFKEKGIHSVLIDAVHSKGLKELLDLTYKLTENKRKQLLRKGIKKRPIRIMILGIPNVGKSTLINSLSKRKGAKVGNKPGVTKANQWIKIKGDLELLDTPGILWPKFEDKEVGLNLAFTGAIKDELLDIDSLAVKLVERLNLISSEYIKNRYKVEVDGKDPHDIIMEIGKKRGAMISGGEVDFSRVSSIIIDEFRKGKIGRITLERPVDL